MTGMCERIGTPCSVRVSSTLVNPPMTAVPRSGTFMVAVTALVLVVNGGDGHRHGGAGQRGRSEPGDGRGRDGDDPGGRHERVWL